MKGIKEKLYKFENKIKSTSHQILIGFKPCFILFYFIRLSYFVVFRKVRWCSVLFKKYFVIKILFFIFFILIHQNYKKNLKK
jgi:hypothetical protein